VTQGERKGGSPLAHTEMANRESGLAGPSCNLGRRKEQPWYAINKSAKLNGHFGG
jgi:hypothetical protein